MNAGVTGQLELWTPVLVAAYREFKTARTLHAGFPLVNHVVEADELKQKALDMACLIATKSSNTLRVAKETLRSALDEGLTEGVATEAKAFAGLFDSEDKEIGVQAFLNREKAQWKHK